MGWANSYSQRPLVKETYEGLDVLVEQIVTDELNLESVEDESDEEE
jgi:hypothetical protein